MYEDSISYQKEINTNISKDNSSRWIIIVLIVLSLIVAYFVLFKDLFKSKTTKLEEEMVDKAKDYVIQNNISTSKEIYLDVSKLNVSLDNNCSLISGVIYDGNNYFPNLVCSNYKSKVIEFNQDADEFIKLKGEEVMVLAKGMNYFDPGYESKDNVQVAGKVGSEEGVYNIYYRAVNSNRVITRKVIIIDNQEIRNLFPILSLRGDELLYIVEGNYYEELGATGYDTIDGNLNNNIITEGRVDTYNIGEYIISYTLTNSRGYSNTITRKVNVIDKNSDLVVDYRLNPESMTNEDVLITLSVSNEFNKIVYPDGKEGKDLSYVVLENGTYLFKIYDIYDRITEKEIEIDNIDKTIPQGSCIATRYYNRTEIKVNMTTTREISSYEYIVDGISSQDSQSNTYVSTKVKPSSVKVKVKDVINNQNELTCSQEDKLTREIITDSKGKNCLEGMVCYVQFDWTSRKYPYCSMNDNPATCGGIGPNGCSITSATNAIAAMGLKSKNGSIYTPWTVWEELYPVNKQTGKCGGSCSGWERIRDAVVNAGLTAPDSVSKFNRNNVQMVIDNLKKGYPVIIYATGHPYSSSKAHYMTLIGIREDGYVFLSDSANTSGTGNKMYNGKKHLVDTWIPVEDLLTGNVSEFLLVGPAGMYKGKLR